MLEDLKTDYQKKSKENLNLGQVKKLINETIKDRPIPAGQVTTFYVECPDVSDLFIITRYETRRSTDAEWTEYFRTILNEKVYGQKIKGKRV